MSKIKDGQPSLSRLVASQYVTLSQESFDYSVRELHKVEIEAVAIVGSCLDEVSSEDSGRQLLVQLCGLLADNASLKKKLLEHKARVTTVVRNLD